VNYLIKIFSEVSSKILRFFSSDLGKTVLTYILIPLCIFGYQSLDQSFKNERLKVEKEEKRKVEIQHLKLEFSYRVSQTIGKLKTIGNEFNDSIKKPGDPKAELKSILNELFTPPRNESYCLFPHYCEKSAIAIVADLIVLHDESHDPKHAKNADVLKDTLSQLNIAQQKIGNRNKVELAVINDLIISMINSQKKKQSSIDFWRESMVFPYLDCAQDGANCTVH
jgi:hypothetical protein